MFIRSVPGLFRASVVLVSFMVAGCGPINEELSKGSKGADQQSAPVASDQRASKAGKYLGHVYLSDKEGKEVSSLPIGETSIHIRLVQSATLRPVSAQAKVKFLVEMPSMPDMGQDIMDGVREAEGEYSGLIFLGMAGDWRVTVQIDDLGQKDEYAFSVSAK